MNKTLKGLFSLMSVVGAGILVGWWLSERQKHAQKPSLQRPVVPSEPTIRVSSQIVLPPEAFVDEPADNDLSKLRGVGPKTVEALGKAGIDSIAKLASSSSEELKTQLAATHITHKQLEDWIVAAKEYLTHQ